MGLMSSSTSHPTLLALIPVSSLVGADLNHLWPFLACWDLPLVLISLCPAAAGPWGVSECLSIHAVLKLIPGCVCHRAVHSDRADGSNSDDGGYRRGRPCVPGTGSGMMAGEGLSPVVSTLGSLCLLAANGEGLELEVVGGEGPIVRLSSSTGQSPSHPPGQRMHRDMPRGEAGCGEWDRHFR